LLAYQVVNAFTERIEMRDELAWPNNKRSIFNLGTSGPGSPTWCSLKWRKSLPFGLHEELYLAEKFKDAGDHVIEHLKTGQVRRPPDGMFMPIAYLYRHSLELTLKHLIRLGIEAQLIEKSPIIDNHLGRHGLGDLWLHVRAAINARWPDSKNKCRDNTEALINDFHVVDRSGQNLRYAWDKEYYPTTQEFPDSIDLVEFKRAYEEVFNYLSGCSAVFDEIIEYIAEMRNEVKGYQ